MSQILRRMFPSVAEKLSSFSYENDHEKVPKKHVVDKGKGCVLGSNLLHGEARVLIFAHTHTHRPSKKSDSTALLFQCAVSFAMEGHIVMFVTHERFTCLPVAVEGAAKPDPVLIKQIHIKYVSDSTSLLKELTQIHTTNPAPDIIIVDGLDYYTSTSKADNMGQVIASLCAHLVDAATFLHNRRSQTDSTSSPTCVMASVSVSPRDPLPSFHDVYTRFLPTTFNITAMDEGNDMKQLRCWLTDENLPQYVVTFKMAETIKIMDIMKGTELDADWSQTSNSVT